MHSKKSGSQSDLTPTPRPVVLGKRRRISSSEEEEEKEMPEWYRNLWKFVYNDPRNNGLNYTDKELVFARIIKRAKLPLYDADERKPPQNSPRRKDQVNSHSSLKMFTCGVCAERFSWDDLRKHLEQHEPQLIDSDDESEVTEISIGEDQSSDSESDVRTPSEELALKQQCLRSVAVVRLARVDEAAQEIDALVAPVEPQGRNVASFYQCDICKASIKYKHNLRLHMKKHLGIRFSCSECQKSFSQKDNLMTHQKTMHQSGLHTCEVCGWSLICTKAEYYSHLRRRHPKFHLKGRRPNVPNFNGVDFPCIYCEPRLTFTNSRELKKHLELTHDRYFACTHCPQVFSLKGNLKTHIERIHEKKMHNCTKCSKVFTLKFYLDRHLRSH